MEAEVDALIEKAHKAALRRFVRCTDEMLDDEAFEGESEASAVYCGCEVCVVREILHAAAPFLQRALPMIDPIPLPSAEATYLPWLAASQSNEWHADA